MTHDDLKQALPAGRTASIPYRDPHHPDRPLTLECHRPATHAPDGPVVIVQHGMSRNGAAYRDAWVPAADRHGVLIVAINFGEAWQGSGPYNNGHVLAGDGSVRRREAWSYAIPGRVFALLRQAGVTTREKAYLWGHSAGGQFVHRLLATQSHAWLQAVGAANSGWYTLPTFDRAFPDGLGGIGLGGTGVGRTGVGGIGLGGTGSGRTGVGGTGVGGTGVGGTGLGGTGVDGIGPGGTGPGSNALTDLLAYPLVIFAGDRDIEPAAANLPKHPTAMQQGPHRFARAHHYLESGRAAAAALGVACNWRLVVVPGVGHDGMRMSAFAAAYWFDGQAHA